MPFVQRRHARPHARKRRKECTNTLRLHPFFSRRKYGQTDDDTVDASRVDDPRHMRKQCTNGRMTKSGKNQGNSGWTLRIGDSRSPRADIKRQDAHGRIERFVTFFAQRFEDG